MSTKLELGQKKNHLSIKAAWLVCFVASLFFLFEFIQLSSFDALNHFIANYFQLNASQISLLGSAFLWGNVIFLLPAGLLLDKFGSRRTILYSLAVSILGVVIFAIAKSFALAFLARFMTGIGNAFCFVSLVVLVSRWFPSNKQAFAMGILVNMAFVGGMFAHTPLVMLLHAYGWQNIMWANAVLGALIWVLIYQFVKNYPEHLSEKYAHSSHESLGFFESLKYIVTSQNVSAGLYTSCLNLPIMVLCALWGMQYLQVVQGMTVYQASNAVSMIFLGSMLGCPLAGFISDKIQKRKPVMWVGAWCALVLSIPLVLSDYHLSFSAMMFIFFSLGVVTSAQVISYPLIAESNASQYSGRACSIASFIIMGGGMLAQMLFGYLLSLNASPQQAVSVDQFKLAMYLFPVSIIIALIAMAVMKETNCHHQLES
jgi:MFS family permease